jgi:hypothetical protein
VKLVALLPKGRFKTGTLTAMASQGVIGTWPCLGKADNEKATANNNPTRDPLRKYGGKPKDGGGLRPTFGCLRVHDETIAEIIALSAKHGNITEVEVKDV